MIWNSSVVRSGSPAMSGIALTLASAILLSALGVLTQLAYASGATVDTLLSGRFLVATAALWPIAWLIGRRSSRSRPTRRQVVAGLALGVAFSAHAWLFSAALARIDVALVDLLVFSYPAMVTLGAVSLGRDMWSTRRGIALVATTIGAGLVLAGGIGSTDPAGAGLALGAAVAYSVYILCAAGQVTRSDPLQLTAWVTTGAALTLGIAGTVRGGTTLELDPAALTLVGLVGLVAAAGMICFVGGVGLLGPSRASIVSAVQPAITPVLGFAVFSDRLAPAQLAGGLFVIAAIVVLETKGFPFQRESAFGSLPRRERRTVSRLSGIRTVPSGTRLIEQGSMANAFFMIQAGRADVLQADRRIGSLGPGQFFGEIGLLLGGSRTATVVAATDMTVRVIHRRDFPWALGNLPTLGRLVREAARDRRGRRTASALSCAAAV